LVHAGKYWTEDKLKNADNTKTKDNPKKQTTQNMAKQKLAWFSRLKQYSSRKRGGLILQRSRAHAGPTTLGD